MRDKSYSTAGFSSGVWFVLFIGLAVGFCVATPRSTKGAESAETQPAPAESPNAGKVSVGPPSTDFNSEGFKISKAVRMERSLNALGIAGQFGKTNKVGKYVELPKRLDPQQRGEHFILTWKYSGKKDPGKTELRFDFKLSDEEHLETITKEYSNLKKGTYRLQVENTGDSYRRRGRIEYWRVTIVTDGKPVATKEAFLWPLFRGEGTRSARGA